MNNLIKIKKRILEISYNHKLGHLGSCFSAVEIIDEIYNTKNEEDIFVLSSGHSGVALYSILEDRYPDINANDLYNTCGVHPIRLPEKKIFCSTGSLGLGITVAVGFALADKTKDVYVLLTDGEIAEGSVWESLKFIYENNINNIHIYVNINGYSAISVVDKDYICKILKAFCPKVNIRYTNVEHFDFLKGIEAHYHVIKTEEQYKSAIQKLEERNK